MYSVALPQPLPHAAPAEPSFARVAGALLAAGAAGVIVTSLLYALAGPEAALPGGAAGIDAARAATGPSAAAMRAASLFGMPSDVLLTVAALMLAAGRRGPGAALSTAGWTALALSGVLFTVVDAMVGYVLPPLAAAANGAPAYLAVRSLFDVLFAIGAWSVGLGSLAVAVAGHAAESRWPAARWLLLAAGVVGVAASSAWLLGLPGERLLGPGIALAAVALLVLAIGTLSPAQRAR